jgi:chemotaxis protein CheY-P-specific phosphatase CheC
MDIKSGENFLINVMTQGFSHAATSFSKLINRPVKIVNTQPVLIRRDSSLAHITEEQGELYVLTTQIIGDISGKSLLIFTKEESQEIFKAINTSVSSDFLNEAFLLEIDNIISASVISELSNSLGLEIYGDVPHLTKIQAKELTAFMLREMACDEHSNMIFCNTTFQFDKKEKVHPQFIWKLSSKVFEIISSQKVTL